MIKSTACSLPRPLAAGLGEHLVDAVAGLPNLDDPFDGKAVLAGPVLGARWMALAWCRCAPTGPTSEGLMRRGALGRRLRDDGRDGVPCRGVVGVCGHTAISRSRVSSKRALGAQEVRSWRWRIGW